MGWCEFHLDRPVKEWFKNSWEYEASKYEVLDSALVQRQHLYGAIKNKETGDVFCAVFLVSWNNSYYNFSYKDMTEFAGPGIDDCPPKIFKLLTPLTDETDPNGWAKKWRERVERRHDTLKKLKKGYVLRTKKPIRFSDGYDYQNFKKIGNRWYRVVHNGNEVKNSFPVRFDPFVIPFDLFTEKEFLDKFA